MTRITRGNKPHGKPAQSKVIAQLIPAGFLLLVIVVLFWEKQSMKNSSFGLIENTGAVIQLKDLTILKSEGDNWQVWNRRQVLYNSFQCRWLEFKGASGNRTAKMCAHDKDIISNIINQRGHWPECRQVLQNYQRQEGVSVTHIELGANIGSCVMELLLETDAEIVAFEPLPKNLFCLTSTLLANPHLAARVTLFPIAVGEETSTAYIDATPQNYGNASLSSNSKGTKMAIERLDDVISVKPDVSIRSAKIDVQGFECRVIQGMPNVLSKIKRLSTEVEWDTLLQYGCSDEELLSLLEHANFTLHWQRGKGNLEDIQQRRNLPQERKVGYVAVGINKKYSK
jgi:FkbM family methyltransferase